MNALAPILVAASACILLVLGAAHLVFTFSGSKLRPRDGSVQQAMESVSPNITRETTMWKAWLGFNASHSLGAILFGVVYSYLATLHPEFLFASTFLLAVGLVLLCSLLVLARLYWFRVPLRGIALALALYVAGLLARLA